MKLGEGVGPGQVINPNHILQIVNALTGKDETDITIKGTFSVTGSAIITQNLNVLGDITANKLIINKDRVKIGNSFIINPNFVGVNNKFYVKGNSNLEGSVSIKENLTITGSTYLLGVTQNQDTKTFLSLNKDNLITLTTGSIKDFEVEKFKFNHINVEDATSFQGKINSISIYKTENIKEFSMFSKLDVAPTWIKHEDIKELQQWVDTNVNEEVFWIKITTVYKDHLTGKSEIIFKYSI